MALNHDISSLNELPSEKKVYVFHDQTNFLSEPKSDSQIIQKLKIDTELTVEADENESKFFSKNKMELPWIKVSLRNNNIKKVGYIWMGDLAKTTLTVDLESDGVKERVLTGFLERIDKDSSNL